MSAGRVEVGLVGFEPATSPLSGRFFRNPNRTNSLQTKLSIASLAEHFMNYRSSAVDVRIHGRESVVSLGAGGNSA